MVYRDLDIKVIYNRLRASAKKRGISFDLTLSQLSLLTFPVTCPILGIPLRFNRGKVRDDSYSVDRIDSNLGYTIDNICVISHLANRMKSNLNLDTLEKLADYLKVISETSERIS